MMKIIEIVISLATAATITACAPANTVVDVAALPTVVLEQPQEQAEDVTYEAALVPFRDGFLKVDQGISTYYTSLNTEGVVETDLPFVPLTALDCDGETVLLGQDSQLAIYQNRQWVLGSAPLASGVADMTSFNGYYLAISDNLLFSSTDLTSWQSIGTGFTSTAIGIASTEKNALALSENGHMLVTDDGVTWTNFFYNAYYNEGLVFQKIDNIDASFSALAVDEDGMPLLASARSGQVWSKQTAEIYSNYGDEAIDVREFTINDVVWDGSQSMMVGNDGVVVALPSCSQCNSASTVDTKNWVKALCEGGIMVMMADDGTVNVISTDTVRQTAISVEETKNQMTQGTPLIDVRTVEEYAEDHIEGSINIPLDELEVQLRSLYPDYTQTLIFYCGTGMRSQKGLEAAKALGYSDVYNMGAMETWYE